MAVLAKGLPVLFIPEKLAVAAMGNDMVDHGCGRQCAVFQTFGAQRMPGQKRLPRLSPVCVIATSGSTAAQTICRIIRMFLTINPLLAEMGTAGITAGVLGCFRHL